MTKLGEGSTPGPWQDYNNEGSHIITAHNRMCTMNEFNPNKVEDARLIAKAPLLIEAREVLERVDRAFNTEGKDIDPLVAMVVLQQVHNLITKLDAE